jgi:hypothetical protein
MSDSRGDKNAVFGGTPQHAKTSMQDQFGFEIPTELIPLPSRGVTYPTESSVHMKEAIEIKAMTAKEEDILTSRALIKNGKVITTLLNSCILNENFDAKHMLSGDRNAILVGVRVTGYGADYRVDVSCPECGEKSTQDFNLTELPIKRMGIEPLRSGENLFEFVLPMSKIPVVFRYMTGADEEDIVMTNARRKKSGMSVENNVTQRLKYSIVQVGEHKDAGKIAAFVQQMPARDSRALRKYMEDNEPGIDMKSWMTCNSCHENSEVSLPMGPSFFWPEAE